MATCEFLQGSSGNFQFGVWQYAVNSAESNLDTGGECEPLKDLFDSDELDWKYRTAQVCSIIAPCGGLWLLLLVLTSQCCCPIPCSKPLISLGYTLAHSGTSLVWLVRTNNVCDDLLGGCSWGDAAIVHLIAQCAYVAASILHGCLPDPKQRRAERNQAKQQTKGDVDQSPANNDADASATNKALQAQLDAANDKVAQLEAELETNQRERSAPTPAAVNGEQDAATIKALEAELEEAKYKMEEMEEENEDTKRKLAAATAATGTAAAVEAAELQKMKTENERVTQELEEAKYKMEEMEEEHEDTKRKLAAATAATGTAAGVEAAEIQKIKTENERVTKELHDLQEEHEHTQKELSTAAQTRGDIDTNDSTKEGSTEIKQLKEENDKLKMELGQQKTDFDNKLQKLEEENETSKKALAAATAGSVVTEAVEIQKLNDEKAALEKEVDELKESIETTEYMQMDLLEENEKVKKALAAATAATGTAAVAEAVQIKKLQEENEALQQDVDEQIAEVERLEKQLEEQNSEWEDKVKDLQEESEESKTALAAATAASSTAATVEAVEIQKLREENDILQKELNEELESLRLQFVEQTKEWATKVRSIEEENERNKAALAAATAATTAAATAEALEIKKLQDEKNDIQTRLTEQNNEVESLREQFQMQTRYLEAKEVEENEKSRGMSTTKAVASDEEEMQRLRGEVQNLEKSLRATEQIAQEATAKLDAKVKDLEAENDKIREISEYAAEIEVLVGENSSKASSLTIQRLKQENDQLKASLEAIRFEYSESLVKLENTELAIREDLAHKIDELHDKNSKRKQALTVATSRLGIESSKLHALRRENASLHERIEELEDENAQQALSLAKATLGLPSPTRSISPSRRRLNQGRHSISPSRRRFFPSGSIPFDEDR